MKLSTNKRQKLAADSDVWTGFMCVLEADIDSDELKCHGHTGMPFLQYLSTPLRLSALAAMRRC